MHFIYRTLCCFAILMMAIGCEGNIPHAKTKPSYEGVCEAQCERVKECAGAVSSRCVENCTEGIELFDDRCADLTAAETACSAALECNDFAWYLQDRRLHPTCGEVATDFIEQCTYTGGVPTECTALCYAINGCNISSASVSNCEERCLFYLTGVNKVYGESCAESNLELNMCMSDLECSVLKTAILTDRIPEPCVGHLDDVKNFCQ